MLKLIVVVSLFSITLSACGDHSSEAKTDAPAADKQTKVDTEKSDSSIIYDTIVFTDNMKGQLLDDKFASSQPELTFYKQFIISKQIDKLITLNEKDVKTEIKYLGQIKDLNNKTSYHVITNFRVIGIGKMLSPRGKTDLAFVNEAKNRIIVYNLPMPQNLPKHISNNILFFEYDSTTIGISIFGGLPPMFCLPKAGCN